MSDSVSKRIYLCLASMGGNEESYIHDAIAKNWVTSLGPEVDRFESLICDFLRKNEEDFHSVLAVSSGTAALHLALLLSGVRPTDEVMCQSWTFSASVNPVCYLGATPVFVDSESLTWNIDPELLEHAVRDRIKQTGKTPKALVVVDLYGMPANWKEIRRIAREYGITLIEDSAEAMGAFYDGKPCGTLGDLGIFSFNGNKIITTGAGGALICQSEHIKKKGLYYATQAKQPLPYYEHKDIGYNYRLSNISAAIGCGQMEVLDKHILHHKRLCEVYEKELCEVDGIDVHRNPSEEYDSNYWLTTIILDDSYEQGTVEELRKCLDSKNIESRPLWKPMHLQPVFEDCPTYLNGVSDSLWNKGLCLPSGPKVSVEDAKYICAEIKRFCSDINDTRRIKNR